MTPERYRQIGEIYHAALEVDAERRAAFLDQTCAGDSALRREVESLISSHNRASDFMAAPALAVAAEMLCASEKDSLIGQTVARYKILSLLGAGGMGRVYLTEDTQLGRRVALKFLPEYFTNDKSQVQRFRHEARAASALNHPNILTVYEVGQVEGTEFIAAEYIEGETLRARLTKGPFSVREALNVATQVADALVAAHAAGIIHRDIKPENVMIRRDGYVKVLDFGLAKLTEKTLGSWQADFESPTIPAIKTNPGVVMGTAEYMSPEQARGLTVDTRTDVWSLGVVVYEMVTGRRPFTGMTHSDIVVSILERQPIPLFRHRAKAPAELERIVTKALTKEADERYQTVKDLAIDLRRLKRQLEIDAEIERTSHSSAADWANASGGEPVAAGSTDVQSAPRISETAEASKTSSVEYVVTEIKKHKRGAMLLGSLLVLLLAGITYGVLKLTRPAQQKPGPFQQTKVTRVTSTGRAKLAAISPDAKYIVYAEEDNKQLSLRVKQVATGSTVEIVPPANVGYWGLTFSNDSNYVYYIRNERSLGPFNNLYQVPSLGGVSQKLLEQVDSAVAFSPDGRRLVFVRDNLKKEETLIVLANADGSGEQTLATSKAPDRFASDFSTRIAWSPDGKTIACAAGRGEAAGVVGVSVEDGSQKPLTSQRWRYVGQVSWLADGSGLVIVAVDESSSPSAPQLWHVSYPDGGARRITNDLNRYRDVSLAPGSNALVTVQTNRVSNIWVAPRGDESRARQITSGTFDTILSWTPDGKLVYWSNASGKSDIWIVNADGSNQRQLTHDGENGRVTVSHDGRYIIFSSTRKGKTNIWRMDIDGANPKQLTDGRMNVNPHVSPDGQWVVYVSQDRGNGTLWKVPIDGGNPVQLTGPTVNLPVVSPDSTQVACFYWDEQASPPRGVMLLPLVGGSPTKRFNIVSPGADAFVLHWTPDGRALLYIDTRYSNIWSQPVDGSEPVRVTDFQGDQVFNFDYSTDGKWLAVARGRITDDVVMISDSR